MIHDILFLIWHLYTYTVYWVSTEEEHNGNT